MEKYDIGVLGLWPGCNYGSVATYYALNQVLTSMGKSVLMIDKPILSNRDIELKMTHSRRFAMEHYNISKQYHPNELYKLNQICDAFVIGSDQVWNYGISKNFGKVFYFDFVEEEKKKIAYAVSFGHGVDFAPPEERKVIAEYMAKIDGISVREADGVRLCRDEYGIKAEQVLDPVFLADPQIYQPIIEKSTAHETEPFLAAYILDPTPEKREAILHLSQKLGGIKIINLLDGMPGTFEKNSQLTDLPNCIEDLQVEDWLYYLSHAEYVITDSCHGASFAIIFNKNLTAITNKRRGFSRFKSLFDLFEIQSHLVTDPKAIIDNGRLLEPIDYNRVKEIMDNQRTRCRAWLSSVLDEPKQPLESLRKRNIVGEQLNKNQTKPKAITSVLDMKQCTGCGACENICSVDAITMTENKEGFLNPVLNSGKCVNCGLCSKKCIALNPEYKNVSEPKCFAMMADDDTRFISSSGGMFTVAAEYVLDKGGYVCGAAYTDNFEVEHIIISDKSQLSLLRGSKYMQSHTRHIYKDVKSLLEDGKLVLFTGMPCQVAGLYAFLGKDYDNLYTIDLLCHGITSSKVFEKYHKDVLDGKPLSRLEFKAKEPWGWHAGVNAYFTDGTTYSKPLESDMYFIAYLKSIAKNTTCGTCGVNRLPRQGDLTIGDFWGIPQTDPGMYDKKGTSVVLVNNEKAQKFFDILKLRMKAVKEEPLASAIRHNLIIKQPYKLHKNREAFFENFDKLDFSSLTMGCYNNQLYDKLHIELVKTMAEDEIEFYYLAKVVAENVNGRKIVTWIHSELFERVLKKYFNLTVAFYLTKRQDVANGNTVRYISEIKGASKSYYLVGLEADLNVENLKMLELYGYKETTDFIFRKHRPVVLENYDCSKGRYSDIYGNTIDGYDTVIKSVVFKGGNNHIIIGKETKGENLEFDLTGNSTIHIGSQCRFSAINRFQIRGLNGFSDVRIMDNCRFTDSLFRLYNDIHTSSILINPYCTFESNLELHANSGKKIIIGKDCMFSHDIDLWAGDGHTIFDVNTGENINSDYEKLPAHRNQIVIGEHVWIAKGAFIMHGTDIGDGSIVGAKSVVKGKFPNNCSIAGNPSSIIRTDIAWSRGMIATNMHKQCGGEKYISPTKKIVENQDHLVSTSPDYKQQREKIENSKIQNWLVTGGSTGLGKELVLKLYNLGYNVIATSRDISKLDQLPQGVIKVPLDVKDLKSCQDAVRTVVEKLGKIDVLVNNAGVSHISTFEETPENIADNIIETNYWGTANMIKAVLPYMHANRNGTVINISSASGFRPRNYGSYYVASKFAVENLTKNLKFECQRFMRFMSVEIGGMNTGLNKRQTVIHTKFQTYKNLPPIYPFKKGYSNNIAKIVNAIINVTSYKELPRDLILGWDAYQQLPQAIKHIENEAEQYKAISITTDEKKLHQINLEDITKPRNNSLKIQNWLITGASGGFGKILALRLKNLGYTVAVTSRDISRLESFPDDFIKIESSLESADECDRVIKKAIEKMGSVDVLVNNATSNCWCSFEECPYDIMKKVFYVNYTLPQYMIKAVLPHMRENKNGTVLNISSIAGMQPRARVSTYSAAKAGLEGLTRVLKSECRNFARFMAVELVCMRTGIMIHNPVYDSKMPDYQQLGRYSQEINNIPNRKDIAAQQIINVVNQDILPQSLPIGTESYLIIKNEIQKVIKDYEDFKDVTLSVCDETELK